MTIPLPIELVLYPVLALAVYGPCLNGSLIFDDLLISQTIARFSWKFTGLHEKVWQWSRPLTTLSWALNRQWPGTVRGMHAGNCLIHAACAGVVEQIARTMGLDPRVALLAGILYICHPYAVNAVGYLTGRSSLLSAFFGLSAVLAIYKGWPVLAFPLLGLAYLSKEDGVGFLAPVLILIYKEGFWWQGTLGILAVIAFAYKKRMEFGELQSGNGDSAMAMTGLPVAYRGWTNVHVVLVETVTRIPGWFLGVGGSPYYGSGIPVPGEAASILAILYTGLAVSALAWGVLVVPLLLIFTGPWLVYLVARVPDQLMDYRNYSMVAGFALFLASMASRLPLNPDWWLVLATIFAVEAFILAKTWRSPQTMWTKAIVTTAGDGSRAYQELGVFYKLKGDNVRAEPLFRKAVELNPNLGAAMNNLGTLAAETGRVDEAIHWMRTCTKRCPKYPQSWEDLGVLYEQTSRFDEAFPCFTEALRLDKGMKRSWNHLGMAAYRRQEFETALGIFEGLMQAEPAPVFVYNVAMTLKALGRHEEADTFGQRINGAMVNHLEIVRAAA